jgi:hypothetical protein
VRTALKGLCVTHQTEKCHQSGPRPVTPSLTQTENTVISHGERSKGASKHNVRTGRPSLTLQRSADPASPSPPGTSKTARASTRSWSTPTTDSPTWRASRFRSQPRPRTRSRARSRARSPSHPRVLRTKPKKPKRPKTPARRASIAAARRRKRHETRWPGPADDSSGSDAESGSENFDIELITGEGSDRESPCPAPLQRSVRRRAVRRSIARSRSTMASRRRRGTRRLRSSPSNSAPSILEARPHRAA